MNTTLSVFNSGILSILLLLGCLWFANAIYGEIRVAYGFKVSVIARLALIITSTGLIYGSANSILYNLLPPVLAQGQPPWRQHLTCDPSLQYSQGIEYCTYADGKIHVIVVDLSSPNVRLEYIMPEGFDNSCPIGKEKDTEKCQIVECKDVNRSTKNLGGAGCDDPSRDPPKRNYYPVMSLDRAVQLAERRFPNMVVAAVINSDYGAKEPNDNPVKWRDHGPEGFTVVRGNRLDGKKTGDGDNNAEKRPWLAVSQTSPLQAEIRQYLKGEDTGDSPDWVYTGVGGAPWMIRQGEIQLKAIQKCVAAPGSCYDGAAQTAVGISQDKRWLFLVADERKGQATLTELADYMLNWGISNAIKFDGGGSTHLWYGGKPLTNDNTRQLSAYLAVIAAPGHGIQIDDTPLLQASPESALVYDIVLPDETAELHMKMRNEGATMWYSPDYEFLQVSGDLSDAPSTMAIQERVPPGTIIAWHIRFPVSGSPGIHRLVYQMHHNGEPFGDIATAYVIVLPEPLKDMEQQLRDQIDEWQRQGKQTIEELMQQIWQSIQEELERQAQNLAEKLLAWIERQLENALNELMAQCFGPIAMAGLALVFVYRKQRP